MHSIFLLTLMDSVRQHPLIYDKSHPCITAPMQGTGSGMKLGKVAGYSKYISGKQGGRRRGSRQ